MPVLRFAQQRVQKHWAATSVPAERGRVRIVVPHSMTDNNSRYDIHSVYSGNYFCNICFHKLHNFHTFIDIIFTILCALVLRISLTLWPLKLTGPGTGRRFIRYWAKRFAGYAAAAGLPDRTVALRLGRAADVRLDALFTRLAWWGRQSERHGCKIVMLASLGGYLASFVVMALVVWAMANGVLNALWGMAGWCCRACCTA